MSDDLHRMGEDLISISARVVRWAPAEQAGVSVAAARILSRLRDAGQMKISDLAVAERSSQPTITNHIKRLEEAGLVERHSDPHDARVSLISATSSGRAKLSAIRYEIGNFLAPRLGDLTEDERKTLREAIDLLTGLVESDR
ncbi:MarR family winged helix-turn-helix transcriptional regulator [Microlunatus soli]|uniref:DNA-binding transcriptional regulator, MarR family n=1 Tax=Microlunatus soli TaxID=630515 RepID=A0A1H1RXM0_9ACTN|nr:MarR family transcriptional regulator [Microlunatus soli]SDS40336.1 DNA-binding transcriptional regulator, MarR family [Microlunatus soli]